MCRQSVPLTDDKHPLTFDSIVRRCVRELGNGVQDSQCQWLLSMECLFEIDPLTIAVSWREALFFVSMRLRRFPSIQRKFASLVRTG
jgi:hypothetical protein